MYNIYMFMFVENTDIKSSKSTRDFIKLCTFKNANKTLALLQIWQRMFSEDLLGKHHQSKMMHFNQINSLHILDFKQRNTIILFCLRIEKAAAISCIFPDSLWRNWRLHKVCKIFMLFSDFPLTCKYPLITILTTNKNIYIYGNLYINSI